MFYSKLLAKVLRRFQRLEICSPKNAFMLFRVLKVISQENLFPCIKSAALAQGHLLFHRSTTNNINNDKSKSKASKSSSSNKKNYSANKKTPESMWSRTSPGDHDGKNIDTSSTSKKSKTENSINSSSTNWLWGRNTTAGVVEVKQKWSRNWWWWWWWWHFTPAAYSWNGNGINMMNNNKMYHGRNSHQSRNSHNNKGDD